MAKIFTVWEEKLTFESSALEGLCNNAGGLALDLLSLPESFAQLLHIVTIHNIRVPPAQTWLNFNSKHHTTTNINTQRGGINFWANMLRI